MFPCWGTAWVAKLLVVPFLDGLCLWHCFGIWSKFWLKSCGRPPTFCMSQLFQGIMFVLVATRRMFTLTSSFCDIQTWSLTLHCLPQATLHLVGLYEDLRLVVSKQRKNESNGACTPSGKNWVHSVWMIVYIVESPNYVWESDRLKASTKGYSSDNGSGLYIAKRGCVSKHPPFPHGKVIKISFLCALCFFLLYLFFILDKLLQ